MQGPVKSGFFSRYKEKDELPKKRGHHSSASQSEDELHRGLLTRSETLESISAHAPNQLEEPPSVPVNEGVMETVARTSMGTIAGEAPSEMYMRTTKPVAQQRRPPLKREQLVSEHDDGNGSKRGVEVYGIPRDPDTFEDIAALARRSTELSHARAVARAAEATVVLSPAASAKLEGRVPPGGGGVGLLQAKTAIARTASAEVVHAGAERVRAGAVKVRAGVTWLHGAWKRCLRVFSSEAALEGYKDFYRNLHENLNAKQPSSAGGTPQELSTLDLPKEGIARSASHAGERSGGAGALGVPPGRGRRPREASVSGPSDSEGHYDRSGRSRSATPEPPGLHPLGAEHPGERRSFDWKRSLSSLSISNLAQSLRGGRASLDGRGAARPQTPRWDRTALEFLVQLALALHGFGVPANRLEEHMTACAKHYGLDGSFFVTPTSVFASFSLPGKVESLSNHIIRNKGMTLNLEKLCVVDQLADSVQKGHVSPKEGLRLLAELRGLPPRYGFLPCMILNAVAGVAFALMINRPWPDAISALVLSAAVWGLLELVSRSPDLNRIAELTAAAFSTAIACLINAFIAPISPFHVALCSLCWLLPGLTVTVAMGELAGRNLVCGTARMSGAVITLFQLAVGIQGMMEVAGMVGLPLRDPFPRETAPTLVIWGALFGISVAWMVLMQARPKDIIIIFIASAAGFYASTFASKTNAQMAPWMGGLAVGLCGNVYSRFFHHPQLIPVLSGILLLVPGSIGLRGLYTMLGASGPDGQSAVEAGVELVFTVALNAVLIVMGLFTANVIIKPANDL
eukprot:tig00000367_g24463.t1